MVPPGVRGTLRRAGREGGLCLHKLHTAGLRERRRMKTKNVPFEGFLAVCLQATALTCTFELKCPLPVSLPWLPSSPTFTFPPDFSDHGAITGFPDLQKTQNEKKCNQFLCGCAFSRSTNLSKTFARPDYLRTSRKVSQEPTAQGFFNQKDLKKRRKKSILHSRASLFYTHLNNVKLLFLL